MLAVLACGATRFSAIQAALPADSSQNMFALQLSVRTHDGHAVERFERALLIDFCLNDNATVRLIADTQLYPATYRESILNNLLALLAAATASPGTALLKSRLPMNKNCGA